MIEVPILGFVQVAGYEYTVHSDLVTDQELYCKNVWADHHPWDRQIRILSTLQPQEWSNSFVHEVLEAVVNLYLAGELEHEKLSIITNGLHQVFEGLNVRFVPRSPESQI